MIEQVQGIVIILAKSHARFAVAVTLWGAFASNTLGQIVTTQPLSAPKTLVNDLITKGYVQGVMERYRIAYQPENSRTIEEISKSIKSKQDIDKEAVGISKQFAAARDLLSTRILRDLPTLTPSAVDRFFDSVVVPALDDQDAGSSSVIYVVSSPAAIEERMAAGWRPTGIRYVESTDEIINEPPSHVISIDEKKTYVYCPLPKLPLDQESVDRLADWIIRDQSQRTSQRESVLTATLLVQFTDFISKIGLTDMPAGEDQAWFADGLAAALAVRYVALFKGDPEVAIMRAISTKLDDRRVQPSQLDLLNPIPLSSIRPEFVPIHIEARKRKATIALYTWLRQGADSKLPVTLTAVARLKPLDGVTLATILRDTSGVDLAPFLR